MGAIFAYCPSNHRPSSENVGHLQNLGQQLHRLLGQLRRRDVSSTVPKWSILHSDNFSQY